MTRLLNVTRSTFSALSVRNYRLFFIGQTVSVSGSWMQVVAQDWLVLQITDSGIALGLATAFQFLPMLLLGPWAGVIADRSDKRRLLLITQLGAAACALALALLTATGTVQLWMIYMMAIALGLTNAFSMPTRQAFVFEMVGHEKLTNAVSLNSIVMNAGRLVGPALAGVLIAAFGLAMCFFINAISYTAIVVALMAMSTAELKPAPVVNRAKGQLQEGLRYVWSEPGLRTPLLMITVIGTFAYNWQVTFSLLARFTFHEGADSYGFLLAAMGLGAVIGGLALATRVRSSHRHLGWATVAMGVSVLVASVMPTLGAVVVVVTVIGATSILVVTQANTTLQLTSAPEMRARVMALYGVAFLGTTPVGGPIVGWVGETLGARAALAMGGIATLAAAAAGWRSLRRAADEPPKTTSTPVTNPPPGPPLAAEAAA